MGIWMILIWVAISLAIEAIRPKPSFEDARPATLGDFSLPTATEGRVLPLLWGTCQIKGPNLIWYGDFYKRAITENMKTGMFSDEDVIVGYEYYLGMQFGLCHGEVDSLNRVWVNEKLVGTGAGSISARELFGGEAHGSGGIDGTLLLETGSQTQTVLPYLSSRISGSVPAYRGTCYVVFTGWIGNTNNVAPWAFEIKRIPDGLNMAAADPGAEAPNFWDANPMNVLYEILTDTDWGLSISPSKVDVPNFQAAASVLHDEGNGFSMVADRAIEVTKLIEEVQRQIDGILFFNRALSQWQVKLARDDYDPGTLDVFDESNIISLDEYTRRTWEETSNQVRVAYVDRADSFKSTFGLAQDPANVDMQGGQSVQSDVTYPGVQVAALANSLAWRDLRVLSYPLAKLRITVNREAWELGPSDVFKFSWARLGITEVVFRIMKINYGKVGNSKITVDAVQDVFGTDVGTFSDPTISDWANPQNDAISPTAANSLIFEAPRQMVEQDTFDNNLQPRAWMGARWPGTGTLVLHSYNRSGTAQPIGGSYVEDATIASFLLTGTLTAGIDAYGSTAARPDQSYNIDVDELDALDPILVDGDSGLVSSLSTVAYCDGEWFGFEKATDQGGGVFRLERLHRGLCNSAPKAHVLGERVWFISVGGSLTRKVLESTHDEMDIQLRGVNGFGEEVSEGSTPELELSLADLHLCPLAPRDPVANSAYAPSSEDIDTLYTTETGRTGDDAKAMEIEVTPRDWTVDDPVGDTVLRPTDWLAESPEFLFTLSLDPDGTPADAGPYLIGSTETPTAYVLRNDVIIAVGVNRSIPSTGRIIVESRHTIESVQYTNPYDMELDLTVTSALQSADDLTHGGVDSTASTAVVYGETGNYTFDIHTALPSSGVLEAQKNGGGWVTVVAAAATTGILAITASDSVELRTQVAKPAADQYFDVTGPVAELGYGVLLS